MPRIMSDLLYTRNDEWVLVNGEVITYGITDYAQAELSDIVYLELPAVGDTFIKGDALGSVESVKAVSELSMPASGEIIEVNEALLDKPEEVNSDPYGSWMVRIRLSNSGELGELLDAAAYGSYCQDRYQ